VSNEGDSFLEVFEENGVSYESLLYTTLKIYSYISLAYVARSQHLGKEAISFFVPLHIVGVLGELYLYLLSFGVFHGAYIVFSALACLGDSYS